MEYIVFNIADFKVSKIKQGWTVYTKGNREFVMPGKYIRFEARYLDNGNVFIAGLNYERKRGYSRPERNFSKSLEVAANNLVSEFQKLIYETLNWEISNG